MTRKPRPPHNNLAGVILDRAARVPDQLALEIPLKWDPTGIHEVQSRTYSELAIEIAEVQAGLREVGLKRGDRVVVMFGVQVELYALVLALMASGMTAVLIDSGMGKKGVIQALRMSRAKAIVSLGRVLRLWPVIPNLWPLKRFAVDGRRWGVRSFEALRGAASEPDVEALPEEYSALITYTSGTTGIPKGSDRTHDILIEQHRALSEHFPSNPGEVDMPCFPVVPLHNLADGVTTVMPAVDYGAPATVAPHLVVEHARAAGVTRFLGAPAYLAKIGDHLLERGESLDEVRALICGGAPTPRKLCAQMRETFPNAERTIIYGSTEAEPIASVSMDEFLETPGEGYLVGSLAEAASVTLVNLPDEPDLTGEGPGAYGVAAGEVGEILVSGAHVLRRYVDNPEATKKTKLPGPDGVIWHRTGDLARWDDQGRLWLVGRLENVVQINGERIYPFTVEVEVRDLPGVECCALIEEPDGDGGLLCFTPIPGADGEEVKAMIEEWVAAAGLVNISALPVKKIPVDPRHNSKVNRRELQRISESDETG